MATKEINLENPKLKTKHAMIYIEGDGTLCLNKINARNYRLLIATDRKKIKEVPNKWEDIITAIHWRDPLPVKNTYTECDEALRDYLAQNNAPCITAFGLKKSFGQVVVRNEIDKHSTKFDVAMNVVANRGLVPITFASWNCEEKVIPTKGGKGVPVTGIFNLFDGWKAHFQIDYTEHVFSLEQIVNIINYAGFGLGIGSGRTSGYGRYHVTNLEAI